MLGLHQAKGSAIHMHGHLTSKYFVKQQVHYLPQHQVHYLPQHQAHYLPQHQWTIYATDVIQPFHLTRHYGKTYNNGHSHTGILHIHTYMRVHTHMCTHTHVRTHACTHTSIDLNLEVGESAIKFSSWWLLHLLITYIHVYNSYKY